MKKRLFPILMAILMVFAMMPMTVGTVYAEADPDITRPEPELDTLQVVCPNDGRARSNKVTIVEVILFIIFVFLLIY